MTDGADLCHGTDLCHGADLCYGTEPGLRFAVVLDGKGGAAGSRPTWEALNRWSPGDGPLWLHLERDHPLTRPWLATRLGIDPMLIDTLTADESRPRVEAVGSALLLVLRGISRLAADTESAFGVGVDLIPIHLWVDRNRVVSLRDGNRSLVALREIHRDLARGRGPIGVGGVLVAIADKIVQDLEPVLDRIEAEVDALEETLAQTRSRGFRLHLAALRRRVIHLRRYLAPQRDALRRLQDEQPDWLGPRDRVLLREVMDKVMHRLEQLDAIRDRTTILHEEMASMIAERIAHTSNRLSAMAALMLPPGIVAAVFGMNVGGIPGGARPFGFYVVCTGLAVMTVAIALVLKRLRWL